MHRRKFRIMTLGGLLLALLAAGNGNAQQQPDVAQVVNAHQEALVTVKYVLSLNMGQGMGGMEQEQENELTCSMVSADGLVICSNNDLSGSIDLIKRISGPAGSDMSATTKDFKVLIGNSPDAYDAEIVARDTELDLAWIRVTDPGDHSFAHLDFSNSADASIGESIITIRRAGSSFGRTPVATQTHIGGISSKPRKLYIPQLQSMNGKGLPAFTADGRIIGLMVTQLPEEMGQSGGGMGMLGAGMANLQDAMFGLILPIADVARATERANEVGH
ncbi:trypsin-like peptidase domain-containing protein [Marinihelvus fidelis]|uniref:Trypsin-like peptidase domain-containing protein n=1 Tax=Marinihelvus fidelis TaxID=2613842 RepID=A0A5N0TL69_9GAMM|nr:trypsin-like peptidase domain-containing protein [Marinihelvus fidelis]KAA9134069.1 trypsin-like peptidase domain-containing protein [Marinihelvus fidelis]